MYVARKKSGDMRLCGSPDLQLPRQLVQWSGMHNNERSEQLRYGAAKAQQGFQIRWALVRLEGTEFKETFEICSVVRHKIIWGDKKKVPVRSLRFEKEPPGHLYLTLPFR